MSTASSLDQKVILGNAWEIIRASTSIFDCIISDPPYDAVDFDLAELQRVCRGNILIFCKPEHQFFIPDEFLFWVKMPSTKNFTRKCGRFVEIILVKRQGSTFNLLHWSQMTGIFDDRLVLPPMHPFEKPLSLIERLVRIYSNPGDLVLDPFCGSGTTLVACQNLGRRVVGIEQDPKYIELVKSKLDFEKIGDEK